MRKCPMCAEPVPLSVDLCPHCESHILAAVTSRPDVARRKKLAIIAGAGALLLIFAAAGLYLASDLELELRLSSGETASLSGERSGRRPSLDLPVEFPGRDAASGSVALRLAFPIRDPIPAVGRLLALLAAPSNDWSTSVTEQELRDLLIDARSPVVSEAELIEQIEPVVRSSSRAAPKRTPLRKIFLQDKYVDQGVTFYREHRSDLEAIRQVEEVDPFDIIAVLMFQSKLGEAAEDSNHRMVTVFLNQILFIDQAWRDRARQGVPTGFDEAAHRERLERDRERAVKSLAALLRWAKKQGADPYEIKGWWSGLIGFAQFSPESLRWARDGDGDGEIDLYRHPDNFASVASYLVGHGYRADRAAAFTSYNPSSEWVGALTAYSQAVFEAVNEG